MDKDRADFVIKRTPRNEKSRLPQPYVPREVLLNGVELPLVRQAVVIYGLQDAVEVTITFRATGVEEEVVQ